jgi:hypothetical protein
MVTLVASSVPSSSRFVALAMLGPFGLSTWVTTSVVVMILAALTLAVVFALRKAAPPTIAEVLRGVDSARTPQR